MSAPRDVGTGLPGAAGWHCENIGPRQRRKRIRFGTLLLVAGAVLAGVLMALDASRASRAVVFIPFAAAGIGLFQVRYRTCVVFAARKVKDMDQGEVPVADARELEQIMRQARMVYAQGLGLGVVLTVVVLLLP
jgi:hypothetical protein